jgi:hypothetical protein
MIKQIKNLLFPFVEKIKSYWTSPPSNLHLLFTPTYDTATKRITEWGENWNIPNTTIFNENNANHVNAVTELNLSSPKKVFAFVGHGSPTELLTDTRNGKPSSCINHGCLLDCIDLTNQLFNVHIVAWSCKSGQIFGSKVKSYSESAFIGFDDEIQLVFNHRESETLWSNLIKETILRIVEKNGIDDSDAKWLKNRITEIRRDIRSGHINTGKYNAFNLLFLGQISRSIVVHV